MFSMFETNDPHTGGYLDVFQTITQCETYFKQQDKPFCKRCWSEDLLKCLDEEKRYLVEESPKSERCRGKRAACMQLLMRLGHTCGKLRTVEHHPTHGPF